MTLFLLSFIGGCVGYFILEKCFKIYNKYTAPVEKVYAAKLASITYQAQDEVLNKRMRKILKNLDKKMIAAAEQGYTSVLIDTGVVQHGERHVKPYLDKIKEYLKDSGVFNYSIERHIRDFNIDVTSHIRISW